MRGDLGQPYGGFPRALQAKVLKGAQPLAVRPGEVLPPANLERLRAELAAKAWREISNQEFASYLMYPKVFLEYLQERLQFGKVSVLPTGIFFYGMQPGDEISVDIERGKTLIVRFVAVSDGQEDGTRTVFFELNGQPRSVKIRDRSHTVLTPPRRKAEPADPNQVGAPMPGTVATVAVKAGSKVARGEVLLTIEAMKMETSVRAERDATIGEVVTHPGENVDAKDLLVLLQ
jgi:pyruvate carboxylase